MARILKKGAGWRLGWNPDPTCMFQGLVGTDDWAVELTAAEFQDFCRLLVQLTDSLAAIAPELMAEEKITIEVESELLWLELEGYVDSHALRMLVLTQRNCEGSWSPAAAPNLATLAKIFHDTQEFPP